MANTGSDTDPGSTSEPLSACVARLEKQVKKARAAGDTPATLLAAKAAVEQIEQRLGAGWEAAVPALSESARAALLAVRRMTFNAAADCWPGWQIDGPRLNREQLVEAREVARYSARLVEALSLGPLQKGTASWLIGAFELALGRFDQAVGLFSKAHQRYSSTPAPGLALLVEGYVAIACQVAQRPLPPSARTLDQVIAAILAGQFDDGAEWVQQLRTAAQVFESGLYA